MTPAENLARAVLETFSGPYYMDPRPLQRVRVLAEAAKHIAPMLAAGVAATESNFNCFRCRNGCTPLYCLNCAGDLLHANPS
jgi:hypothetical protein